MPLTDTLSTPSGGARVFAPVAAPNPLGAVADTLGGLITASDKRETDGITRAKFDREQADKRALNEVSIRGADAMAGVPTSAVDMVSRIMTVKKASDSGAVPTTMADMHTENFVQDVMHKYPDSAAVIFQYAQAQGLNHVAFRAFEEAEAARANQITTQQSTENDLIKLATNRGADPNMTRSELISLGSQYAKSDYSVSLIKQERELQSTGLALTAAQQAADDRDAFGKVQSALTDLHSAVFSTLQANMTRLASAIEQGQFTNPAEADKIISTAGRDLLNAAEAQRQQDYRLIDNMRVSPTVNQQLKAQVDRDFEAFKVYRDSIFTGPASEAATNIRAYQNAQAQLGLNAQMAMPILSGLYKGMGPSFLVYFGPNAPQLSPEMAKAASAELNNVNVINQGDADAHFTNAIGILTGKKKIEDIQPSGIPGVNPWIVHGINSAGPAIASGAQKSPEVVTHFVNNVAALYSQFNNSGPFAPSPGASVAIATAYSRPAAEGLIQAIKLGNTEAQDTLDNGRGSAYSVLQNLKRPEYLQSTHDQFGWQIRFNEKTSHWEATPDPAKVRSITQGITYMANEARLGPGNTFSPTRMPADVQTRLNDLNTLTGFIAYTRLNGDDAPRSATQRSYAAWIATGSPLRDNKGQVIDMSGGKGSNDVGTIAETIHTQAMGLIQGNVAEASTASTNVAIKPIVDNAATNFNVPLGLAHWMIGQEGHGRTRVDKNKDGKPDSTAFGWGQFIDKTAEAYGLKGPGFDYREDPTKAIPASMRYLSKLAASSGGDWIKALHKYGTLARSNFDSDAEYNAAVDAARRALASS